MSDQAPAGSLYLLDAHGMIFQMFYGVGQMSAPDGRPTNAVFGVTRALMNLYDRGAAYLIAALDHKEPTFREALDANYKAHRDPPPPDLLAQEPMIQQVMEAMGVPFLIAPGYEADDLMATVSAAAAARGLDVFLCTSDKDCRQLVTDKVKMLNLRKDYEVLDAAGVLADWGVRPDQVVDFQALVGDSVDNIPGVPGVGPKTAAKWIQELGSLDAIIATPDKVSGGPKVKQALKDAIANGKLATSRRLVRLDPNVPVAFDWDGWKRRDWDGPRLLELFHEFGFRSFAERVRKTLTASGAARNAAALEIAGLAPASERKAAPAKPARAPRGKKAAAAPTGPSLFDTLMGEAPAPGAAPAAPAEPPQPADNWDFSGYRLVDTPEQLAAFLAELKAQKAIVFDLETTGLDPLRSEIVGYAFCWEKGKAHYLPVRAPAGDAQLDPANTLAALMPIFEDAAVEKRNHNIKFDQIALAASGVDLRGVAGDSMIAHYLLHPGARAHGLDDLTRDYLGHQNIKISELIGKGKKQTTMDKVPAATVGKYACEDADTAFQLAARLEPELVSAGFRDLYEQLELPLVGVLADMERTGIRVDVPFLQKLGVEMAAEVSGIEKEVYALAGREFNIASLKELQKVLFEEQKFPVQKRTGIKNEPSTDQESLERLAALGHELPRRLVAYRQVTKLKNTYVDVLPAIVNPDTHRVHTSFNQTAAETGRLSSSDPNLQNIPARTEQGAQLRKAFVPREGWTLVTADYSQIELRLLAHFSGDETLRAAFAEDRDVHAAVAAQIFKVPEAGVTKAQRGVAKTVNFGVLYGMSATGLSVRLAIPRKEAEEFIDTYFARYPKVLDYQQRLLANAHKSGVVGTILGRKRAFSPGAINPNSSYRGRGNAEREAINMEIQGSAADLMKKAMLAVSDRLAARKLQSKMLLTVHDELVFEAPPGEVAELAALAREEMAGAMTLDVPLKVDVAAGPNWLDVSDV
ncbi:dna polymerase i : DNA polymerase I OS=Pirellula staleyi (strain ATCC 27377 / DSM 6068 / ICPB 4128) GN=Psta_3785 PE=3 SV=1: 5_3_exonuc_N: 5_3_exonuc: DNA_pol_A_exo1: DNA_pol_A [Gemmataceae bacterium]|nr:dna polymerase i : DNA polymerase I OS=Pirellula staleyi (strain ATCC 27377 / DSM 6068 / ICPB 4128) GN=Psta_3785 PE=3 SV=1: 5_3_exonuc_N: 5_3_exonuc: DNA_pol_A_exo1: DNA_pol_A [Gemmataceae bacterium]VTT96991.1 dna polymerase i : DNA polymerase I OS=Pirellula staleyi (strain ATCC 27377 / DSM 6068 / ICPB 4128) GN=Psta_3785 PE=3 SV=1: 5_3_exonuc_N: 5_3_exonuc: DNA_pol_A_exo1: DNA_pol_A [Gemmataceae bacterium]